ncbi:hypothetical protein KJ359_004809 [Pestalotiopsis sp. 9143b]|nr:hypothetical protein KJ359_004809 [Pestalotiopsis sp. 9143b]
MGYTFLIDSNLPINTDDEAVARILHDFDVSCEETTDLPLIGREIRAHKPDVAYIPSADWHRSLRAGDTHYSGLVIPTSKFHDGQTDMPSVLVVKRDDPAAGLMDLKGASYGYINKSCTSSYFPPAVMLNREGIRFDEFLDMRPVRPWQGQIDAVVAGEVRATMVPEDTWRSEPGNAETSKVVDRFEDGKPAVVVARSDLDSELRRKLADALVAWAPPELSIYGRFKLFEPSDTESLFKQLDRLPKGI